MSDPLSPKSPRKGKIVNLRILFLDDTLHAFQVPIKALGQALWDAVVKHLPLVEADYFDLEYLDAQGLQSWLDREKPILKQLPSPDTPLRFCVKFYTPDPALLDEEFTRYLFALQVKRDLANGALPCSENTAAVLASYVAQAETGDFPIEEYVDHTYLSGFKFVPKQTEDLEKKIMEYHKQHVGESPAEADLNLLDTARKVELYGIRLCPAKDHEGVSLALAVAHMGVQVFQNSTKINTFSWAKIRKLSFKRKKFLIKLHPDSYMQKTEGHKKGYYKDTVEFFFDSRNECKCFWKKCIEHHAFFRCQAVKKLPRNKTRVVSRGSSFRYSGRTQKQLMEFVRENFVKRPPFERSVSGRISTSRSTSVTPKIPAKTAIHNSSELHNSTASSGSHTLETTHDNHMSPNRVETAEVHSDSSLSGSRSLGSLKLERGRSEEDTRHEGLEGTVGDSADVRPEPLDRVAPPVYSPARSPHALQQTDRKLSAPVLGSGAASMVEKHLARSSEVENIPEVVEDESHLGSGLSPNENRHSITRSMSANVTMNDRESPPTPPPPPPPPPLDEDVPASPPSRRSTPQRRGESLTPRSSTGGLASNMSAMSSTRTEESEEDARRKAKRHPVDRGYYIAKELLMTERTYRKDLEVLTVWFRNAVSGEESIPDHLTELFQSLDPIYEFHCGFLKEIEQRLAMWEGKANAHLNGNYQRIGDIMVNSFVKVLEFYKTFLERQGDILMELEQVAKKNRKFEIVYKDFESQKVCYLPLNTFLLKPGHRLLHYKLILERLTKHYATDHPDFEDCKAALTKIVETVTAYKKHMRQLDNLQKLMELQRDLVGIENLASPDREFIREGCLQKFSRKGYQQRMFFLFSDILVYTSRTATSLLQFKVHGEIPLRGMMLEESESDQAKMAVANSFAIYGGNKCILVAASSQEEKDKWVEDLNEAVVHAKNRNEDKLKFASLKSSTSSSENVEASAHQGKENGDTSLASPEKQIQHRANTTMHVCWHRNTSVSMRDHEKAVKNQLSGYLLRKFKNSNGWQKLWVVFTNFCLFFYKTYQDDFPLASLPLLGYAVTMPEDEDAINKDHVFKLQFKNHVYYFRAESEYTFERWMEVINCATSSARRTRLFSRLDSSMNPC